MAKTKGKTKTRRRAAPARPVQAPKQRREARRVPWEPVFPLAEGAGPVAWSAGDPDVGYVVGVDRMLCRTQDRGGSWRPVRPVS